MKTQPIIVDVGGSPESAVAASAGCAVPVVPVQKPEPVAEFAAAAAAG